MSTIRELWENVLVRYGALMMVGATVVYMAMEWLRGFAMQAVGGAL